MTVPASRVHEIVLQAEHVLDEPHVAGALRAESLQPTDVDIAHAVAAGDERSERLRRVGFTFCPILVRLNPRRAVFNVRFDNTARYSPVKN